MNKVKKTPIELMRFSLNNNNIYIKREDKIQEALGGNKARKVMYFLEDALKKNSDCIVTYGCKQSNHCRVISNMAATLGLKSVIIVAENNKRETNGNYLLMNLFNSKIVETPINAVKEYIEKTMKGLKDSGFNPYFIEGGGHGNLGTKAYLDCYDEIKGQEKELDTNFHYIFHGSGTGTTQGGLCVGNFLRQGNEKIIGISVAREKIRGRQVIYDSIMDYKKENNLGFQFNIDDINFLDDYRLEGYGKINESIIKTIRDISKTDGILLDPTYTGKAFWGMKEYIIKNNIKHKNILFIHTGGLPLVFDNSNLFI